MFHGSESSLYGLFAPGNESAEERKDQIHFATGQAARPGRRPGHVNIALDITAVDIDLFFLYSTGTMIMYDIFSL